jgi:hypothetical protein
LPGDFQNYVVDQTGFSDADGGCEDRRLEVGDLDVVDVKTVQLGASLCGILGGEGPGQR